jgi:hypothetical protein
MSTHAVRLLQLLILGLALTLTGTAFAQEEPPQDQPPTQDEAPAGPVLAPANYTPIICDPSAASFRYLEVRGTGFNAWATQRLVGSVVDAAGAPRISWSSIWVSPQGRLTLEVNLCADPIQKRPALPAGDYTVSVGTPTGTVAATGISLTTPPEPGEETAPAASASPQARPNPAPTETPFVYIIPTLEGQSNATPLPVAVLPEATPTPGPRTGPGSLQQPLPQGATGMLVDGWQLVITGVTPDAFKGIKTDVPSATSPASDQRDFMVRAQATYQGPGTGVFSGARLALMSAAGTTYDQIYNSCGVIPAPLPPIVITAGNTVRGNVCFTVRASDSGTLVLFDNQVSDADRVYFTLQ